MARRFEVPSPTDPPLVDSHAHLSHDPLVHDPEGVVERALHAGVDTILTVGTDPDDAINAVALAERFPRVFAAVGIHPHGAKLADDRALDSVASLARRDVVKGYGEIGLDFYWNHSTPDRQRAVFRDQILMGKNLNLPLIIHLRDAYGEGLDLLEAQGPYPAGGVIHCFSGNDDDARRALDLNFHLSFPGTVTFKSRDDLRALLPNIPEHRILLETDCPFLAPVPLRGKVNEPAFMVHTAARISELMGLEPNRLARITRANTFRLFGMEK